MSELGSVEPRFLTPRDPWLSTDGHLGAEIARAHGREWLPWQQAAADMVGEIKPDGRYSHPVVVVLVPRQCGKTTWLFDLVQGRCRAYEDYRAAYTAQTGTMASERFLERMTLLTQTDLFDEVHLRRSMGTERITFTQQASWMKAFPPKDGSLRGSVLDLVAIDEPQEVDEEKGRALDQTILPTFTTRKRRQLLLVGTAGTATSAYLARYLKMAREGAPGVGLVLFGADEDEEHEDPAVWRRRHPGLSGGLTDEDALQSALNILGPEGFAREYLNVWQIVGGRVIPAKAWKDAGAPDSTPRKGIEPVLGVAVAADRSAACIAAVWPAVDGPPVMEVVDHRPNADWVAYRLAELARHGVIWADSQGPVLTVVDDLRRLVERKNLRIRMEQTSTADYTAACANMLDRILSGGIRHRTDPVLDVAAAGADRRSVGDGAWAWGRRRSSADIGPLEAATVALWGHMHRPVAKRRPMAA